MTKWTINRSLLPLKLILFCYHGAAACILPYLSVHMRSIGITVEETAIIYAMLPVVGFLGPPIAGFFADRLGRYQPVLITSLVATAVFHSLLLAIPPMSTEVRPADVSFTCHRGGAIVHVSRCPDAMCPPVLLSNDTDLELADCSLRCAMGGGDRAASKYNMIANSDKRSDDYQDVASRDNMTSADNTSTSATPVQMNVFDDEALNSHVLHLSTLDISLFDLSLSHETALTCEYELDHFLWGNQVLTNMTCPQFDECLLQCTVMVVTPVANSTEVGSAAATATERPNYPLCEHFVGNHLLTFSTYFVLRVIGGVFISVCFTLMDATCFAMIADRKAEYGRQKIFSTLANAIFSPITGVLIDHMSDKNGKANYAPAFYMFNCLIVLTIIVATQITFKMENSTKKMVKNLKLLLKRVEVVAFFLTITLLGTMWGFLETFLFWYMLDLDSPKYLLGLTVTIGAGVSIPVLFCAEKIVKRVGNINLLIVAFAVYSVRMVGYSFIHNPWWSLAFESLEVITINLMWVAAATYGTSIAPKGLLATMQGAMGGMHYGIGRGVGSFVGGLLMQSVGTRITFRVMGVTSALACITASIFYFAYFRCRKTDCDYGKSTSVVEEIDSRTDHTGQELKMLAKDEQTEDIIEDGLPVC